VSALRVGRCRFCPYKVAPHKQAEARWRRIDHDNMRLSITLDDPKIYTKPWTSKEINCQFQPTGTPHGELVEAIFAPIDEQTFNQNVRDKGEPKK
jgi:hypothetical protein